MKKFEFDFFQQDALVVAEELMGQTLVYNGPQGLIKGRISEVEAYLGEEDPACHTFGGRVTDRTRVMYKSGGHVYIYIIYGMYNCLNVVTGPEGKGQAVLIRGIEPVDGIDIIQTNRGNRVPEKNLCNGPGKLCRALKIDRTLNGTTYLDGPLSIFKTQESLTWDRLDSTPRIGVDYAGDAAQWPLRYILKV